MLTRTIIYSSICSLILVATISYGDRDNSKYLGNQLTEEERRLHKRKRPGYQGGASGPCIGGYGKPKNQPSGRTFFDLQFLNVQNEHNYNLNINCGGGGGDSGGHYPAYPAPVTENHLGDKPGGIHKPGGFGGGGFGGGGHRPPHRPGGGGGFGNGGFFGGGHNKPQGGPFNQGGGGEGGSSNPGNRPQGGAFASAVAGIFPSPQEFAGGLSDGIQSFIGTIPAIGQSFASILPSFSDFQLPQFQLPQFNPGGSGSSGSFSNPFNRPPAVAAPTTTTAPAIVTSAPLTTTTDPDDIIYSDEIKPVNEDYDPITDPYISNKLPPGRNRYKSYTPRGRSLYQDYREESPKYRSRNQDFYQHSAPYSPRGRSAEGGGGGGFRFPS